MPEQKTKSVKTKRQIKLLLVIFAILILLVAIFLIFIVKFDGSKRPSSIVSEEGTVGVTNSNQTEEENNNQNEEGTSTIEDISGAAMVIAGTSLVSSSGKVIDSSGRVLENDAAPMSELAPKLSVPLDSESLPQSAVKLTATESGFSPDSFTVSAGAPITLTLTSSGADSRLVFQDPSLSALELPVPVGYTMGKTFNAPSAPGEYVFFQDIPGRRDQVGKMIVK